MRYLISVLVLFAISNSSYCQDIHSLNDYKEFISIGKKWNDVKVGKWIDLSTDSIIYRSGSYDSSGVPKGIWSVYFPNGDLRKTTEYKDGKIISWACYVDNAKVLEVSGDEFIDMNIFKEILYKETYAMEFNDTPYKHTIDKQDDFTRYKVVYLMYYNHINILYRELIRLLRFENFNGFLKTWNLNDQILKDHHFKSGKDFETNFIYKKERLKYLKELINDTVKKITTYKKDGSIKMIIDK